MKAKSKIRNISFFCFILAVAESLILADAVPVPAGQSQSDQYHAFLKTGIEKSLNLNIVDAEAYMQKAGKMEPENPTAYACLAFLDVFAYETSFDEQSRKKYQDAMLYYVDETMTLGQKRIAANPNDGKAYMAMAMAKIAKVRWATLERNYLVMAEDTVSIWDYLKKARQYDPDNYDVLFLMGIFHYHIYHLPGFIRFISSVFITSGDRWKGLEELKTAAQKGNLLRELARVELASVYFYFEKEPERSLIILQELKKKYPDNYNLLFALANTLSELHHADEANAITRTIENNIRSATPPFVPELQPRYDQLMGKILFDQDKYADATDYFKKALDNKAAYNARVRAWSYVRLGMIQDVLKQRDLAESYYNKALNVECAEGAAQIAARDYLQNPYSPPAATIPDVKRK